MPRKLNNERKNKLQRIDISELQRYVAVTMGFLLIVFIIAQFVVLDLAGIHGPEITKLTKQEDQLKLEIELKRAEINEMSKSDDIRAFATTNLGYKPTSVNVIQITSGNTDNTIAAVGDQVPTEVTAINR